MLLDRNVRHSSRNSEPFVPIPIPILTSHLSAWLVTSLNTLFERQLVDHQEAIRVSDCPRNVV